MNETEIKDLPFSGFHKRASGIFVLVAGIGSLLIVALRLHRTNDDVAQWALGAIALLVVGIAVAYYTLTRNIDRLREKLDEKSLSALYSGVASLAQLAYLICIMALGLVSHH